MYSAHTNASKRVCERIVQTALCKLLQTSGVIKMIGNVIIIITRVKAFRIGESHVVVISFLDLPNRDPHSTAGEGAGKTPSLTECPFPSREPTRPSGLSSSACPRLWPRP